MRYSLQKNCYLSLVLKDEQEFSRPIREGNSVSGRGSSINRNQGGMRGHHIFWAQPSLWVPAEIGAAVSGNWIEKIKLGPGCGGHSAKNFEQNNDLKLRKRILVAVWRIDSRREM